MYTKPQISAEVNTKKKVNKISLNMHISGHAIVKRFIKQLAAVSSEEIYDITEIKTQKLNLKCKKMPS